MNIEIKDLDELIGTNKVKISEYEIDLNQMPLSSFIEINAMLKNMEEANEERILEKIIYPIIKKEYMNVTLEKIKETFTYNQIIILWKEIIKTLYPMSDITEDEDVNKVKKK